MATGTVERKHFEIAEWEQLMETWRSMQSSAMPSQPRNNEGQIADSLNYLHNQVDEIVTKQRNEQEEYEGQLDVVVREIQDFYRSNDFAQPADLKDNF